MFSCELSFPSRSDVESNMPVRELIIPPSFSNAQLYKQTLSAAIKGTLCLICEMN